MPIDATLLKTERNSVFELLKECQLRHDDFRWQTTETSEGDYMYGRSDYSVSMLVHVPTQFYYRFGAIVDKFSPGSAMREEMSEVSKVFSKRLIEVKRWAARVKREHETPDLWEEFQKYKGVMTSIQSSVGDNSPFTVEERELLSNQLKSIRDELLSIHSFNSKQFELIDSQFDELRRSSERLGRKDWKNAFVGVVFSIIITVAMDPQKAHDWFARAAGTIQWVWQAAPNMLK